MQNKLVAILILSFSIMIAIIFVDIYTPSGITDGALYVIPVLLMLPYGRRYTRLFAAIGTLLIIIGYYLSDTSYDIPAWFPIVNRTLSFIAIWCAAILGTQWNDIILQARLLNNTLDGRNVRLLDIKDRIEQFQQTNAYKASKSTDKAILEAARHILADLTTFSLGVAQLEDVKKELFGK